jgi:hypothetical protein
LTDWQKSNSLLSRHIANFSKPFFDEGLHLKT